MKELTYLLTTKYKDQEKFNKDSAKGWKVLEDLRAKKLPEFKKIQYYENQLEFWEEELGVNYFFYFLEYCDGLMLINISDFELFSPESERSQLNEWLLEKASEYISRRIIELKGNEYLIRQLKFKYVSFDSLKMDFELLFTESSNPFELVKNELLTFDKKIEGLILPDIYNYYREYKIAPDYSKVTPQINYLLKINNTYQYALYRDYLQNVFDKYAKKNDSTLSNTAKAEQLTSAQIALILHYTGVLEALQNHALDNTVKARIISSITGNGYKGIYDPIGKVHNDSLKTKKNLIAVLKRLKECDLDQFTSKVDFDLKTAK